MLRVLGLLKFPNLCGLRHTPPACFLNLFSFLIIHCIAHSIGGCQYCMGGCVFVCVCILLLYCIPLFLNQTLFEVIWFFRWGVCSGF